MLATFHAVSVSCSARIGPVRDYIVDSAHAGTSTSHAQLSQILTSLDRSRRPIWQRIDSVTRSASGGRLDATGLVVIAAAGAVVVLALARSRQGGSKRLHQPSLVSHMAAMESSGEEDANDEEDDMFTSDDSQDESHAVVQSRAKRGITGNDRRSSFIYITSSDPTSSLSVHPVHIDLAGRGSPQGWSSTGARRNHLQVPRSASPAGGSQQHAAASAARKKGRRQHTFRSNGSPSLGVVEDSSSVAASSESGDGDEDDAEEYFLSPAEASSEDGSEGANASESNPDSSSSKPNQNGERQRSRQPAVRGRGVYQNGRNIRAKRKMSPLPPNESPAPIPERNSSYHQMSKAPPKPVWVGRAPTGGPTPILRREAQKWASRERQAGDAGAEPWLLGAKIRPRSKRGAPTSDSVSIETSVLGAEAGYQSSPAIDQSAAGASATPAPVRRHRCIRLTEPDWDPHAETHERARQRRELRLQREKEKKVPVRAMSMFEPSTPVEHEPEDQVLLLRTQSETSLPQLQLQHHLDGDDEPLDSWLAFATSLQSSPVPDEDDKVASRLARSKDEITGSPRAPTSDSHNHGSTQEQSQDGSHRNDHATSDDAEEFWFERFTSSTAAAGRDWDWRKRRAREKAAQIAKMAESIETAGEGGAEGPRAESAYGSVRANEEPGDSTSRRSNSNPMPPAKNANAGASNATARSHETNNSWTQTSIRNPFKVATSPVSSPSASPTQPSSPVHKIPSATSLSRLRLDNAFGRKGNSSPLAQSSPHASHSPLPDPWEREPNLERPVRSYSMPMSSSASSSSSLGSAGGSGSASGGGNGFMSRGFFGNSRPSAVRS
ncbi:unnamed protein product [Jaminaea pallidilutea]